MDPATIYTIAATAWLVGNYLYHRIWDEPELPNPAQELKIPRTDEGATVPLIYGRYRVRSPVVAWAGSFEAFPNPSPSDVPGSWTSSHDWYGAPYLYGGKLLYALAMPFDGSSVNRIHSMYGGDQVMRDDWTGEFGLLPPPLGLVGCVRLEELTGEGLWESDVRPCYVASYGPFPRPGGFVEFLNGNPSQQLVDPVYPHSPSTSAGEVMLQETGTPENIPGYRGIMCLFLGYVVTEHTGQWWLPSGVWGFGSSANLPAFSFEVSSYPQLGLADGNSYVGVSDANPIDVIYDLLTGTRSKLAIPGTRIDTANFADAARTLLFEGHGFSIAFEDAAPAEDMIGEVLKQIDGVLYEDPTTMLIKVKLVRGDYDADTVPHINETNCLSLDNYSCASWSGVVNKVKVLWTNRASNYIETAATAHNQANAVGQNGEIHEITLRYPGVCTPELAKKIAARELAARSRPLARCTAIVDRTFYRVCPGDPVAVTWPDYNISGVIFRVAGVRRGVRDDGKIELDLLQDYFYKHRNRVTSLPPIESFPVVVAL